MIGISFVTLYSIAWVVHKGIPKLKLWRKPYPTSYNGFKVGDVVMRHSYNHHNPERVKIAEFQFTINKEINLIRFDDGYIERPYRMYIKKAKQKNHLPSWF